tara:strand:+ start:608 stop:931 length:324 start_codon:yes stop_codon:yes gene_type:complete
MMTFRIKQNDTSPQIEAVLSDAAGTAIDLSGAAVRFHMRRAGGAVVIDAAATIVTAAAGLVRYVWLAGDTATAGSYQAEFEATYADGAIETFPNAANIQIDILADIT